MVHYKHPIQIQRYPSEPIMDVVGNDITQWVDVIRCRAQISGVGGKEYYAASAQQAENDVTFIVRYCKVLADITPQSARIVYDGKIYKISHVDDYMQTHESIKIRTVVQIGETY